MATVRTVLRKSTVVGKEGSLYFRVIHERVARTVFTGYHLLPDEWDEASSSVIVKGNDARRTYLEQAEAKVKCGLELLRKIIAEKEEAKASYTADDVVSEYEKRSKCMTVFTFISSMVARKEASKRFGTAKTYRDALSSFSGFRNGEDISLDELDKDIICRYEAWMKDKGLKLNTSSCYLRTLKTLYLKAVDMGLTDEKDIFGNVFTGFATTTKRAVTIENIRKIRKLRLKDGSALAFARDMFMLSFYLQGMSFVDMAYLKKTDLQNGMLTYRRRKTGQELSIKWEKCMAEIIAKYPENKTGFLLPIIKEQGDERRQYDNALHLVNYRLKELSTMLKLQRPLTMYVARHSWASAAKAKNVPLSVISEGMGHDSETTTQIYLASLETSVVDKANKMILGLL